MRLVLTTSESEMSLPVESAEEVCLSFRHSVYGSNVEEAFVICSGGLELRQLRYEEPRLAEYYGHDHADRLGKWWVVEGNRRIHPSISMRVSADSRMRLSVGAITLELPAFVRNGGSIRVSVTQDQDV